MVALDAGFVPPLSTGFFPRAVSAQMQDNSRMSETDEMIRRIDQLMAAGGWKSDRQLSMVVTGKPDVIRDLRRKGVQPRGETLAKLARALATSSEFLLSGEPSRPYLVGDRRQEFDAGARDPVNAGLTRNLPVYGTALGADVEPEDNGDHREVEAHIIELTEVIDVVRRPPVYADRKDVYALYVSGNSMDPRHEAGDLVLVDPKKPVRPGDDVIVQLIRRGDESGDVACALIKRLVHRGRTSIELRQYNPAMTFTISMDRVASIHRVVSMRELIG